MPTFDIAVFTTEKLYDESERLTFDGYRARDRAVTWVKEAFDVATNHDANVWGNDEIINPPQEAIRSSFHDTCHCVVDQCYYANLNHWWSKYIVENCTKPSSVADDVNVLLTNADGGGVGNARDSPPGAATVWGANLMELPSNYSKFRWKIGGKNITRVLHEIGHSLLYNVPDWDNDGVLHHDVSSVVYDGDENSHSVTPMGISGSATRNGKKLNSCNNAYDKEDAKDGDHYNQRAVFYNDWCAGDYLTKLKNQN